MNGGHFEFTVKNGCEGPMLVLSAMLRTREAVNEFITAFDPLQLAMFPVKDDADAEPLAETGPDPQAEAADAEAAVDGEHDDTEPSPPALDRGKGPEPLVGTGAGDVLAALRAGAFDHRNADKRCGLSRYEARCAYERLVANGWWTPASEGGEE